jgi:isopenicillin N synthase-like dioxygenase
MRISAKSESNGDALPVIDFAAPGDGEESRIKGMRIVLALSQSGGFHAINHGIAPSLIDEIFHVSRWFFAQPEQQRSDFGSNAWKRGFLALRTQAKPGFAPDDREAFDLGIDICADDPRVRNAKPFHAPNHWPDWPGAMLFRDTVERYFSAVRDFGFALQGSLAHAMGVPQGWLHRRYGNALASMRLLHYPNPVQQLERRALPMAPHTDFGAFTFILQDGMPGLEYGTPDGNWHEVTPVRDALFVFGGDLLQHWSAGRFKALPHRVAHVPGRERFSVCTFYNPDFDAELMPFPTGIDTWASALPVPTCGEYIAARARTREQQSTQLRAAAHTDDIT